MDAEQAHNAQPLLNGVLLQAKQPFSNARHIRQLVAMLAGEIIWLDRHADLVALDIIGHCAIAGQQTAMLLIREGRPEDRLIREASRLRQELAPKAVDFDFRYVMPNEWEAHDRWIVGAEGVWSLPPANSLTKIGELKLSADPEGVRRVVEAHLGRASSVFG